MEKISGHGLVGMVVLGWQLDSMILKVLERSNKAHVVWWGALKSVDTCIIFVLFHPEHYSLESGSNFVLHLGALENNTGLV